MSSTTRLYLVPVLPTQVMPSTTNETCVAWYQPETYRNYWTNMVFKRSYLFRNKIIIKFDEKLSFLLVSLVIIVIISKKLYQRRNLCTNVLKSYKLPVLYKKHLKKREFLVFSRWYQELQKSLKNDVFWASAVWAKTNNFWETLVRNTEQNLCFVFCLLRGSHEFLISNDQKNF